MRAFFTLVVFMFGILSVSPSFAEDNFDEWIAKHPDWKKKIDANGDGVIDDIERKQGHIHWKADLDNNPPGPVGGAGTNWENPAGPAGGPGAGPRRI